MIICTIVGISERHLMDGLNNEVFGEINTVRWEARKKLFPLETNRNYNRLWINMIRNCTVSLSWLLSGGWLQVGMGWLTICWIQFIVIGKEEEFAKSSAKVYQRLTWTMFVFRLRLIFSSYSQFLIHLYSLFAIAIMS